jgi:NADP-dependent 3-hydroxy acid dehydrogenase YdfG
MSYRAQPQDGLVWITGASSGIGRAVALEMVKRGYRVAISARRADALEALCKEAPAGSLIPAPCDVTDAQAVLATVERIEQEHGPIMLAFLNAGTYKPVSIEPFVLADWQNMFDVNIDGVLTGLNAVLPRFLARGKGQLALNASVAGFGPLPRAAVYGATKAALIHMAGSLRFDCEPKNITVQAVCPGFVETPLTAKNDHPMPFIIPVDDAARRICDGFAQGGFEITFPRRMKYLLKALNLLPWPLYFWLVGKGTGASR